MRARQKKTKQNIDRRPFWERFLEWILGFVKKMLVPALVIWLVTWLWAGGIFAMAANTAWQGFVSWTADQGFKVQDVVINGRVRTDIDVLKDVINVPMGHPILDVDVKSMQNKIEKFVWVDTVSVQRSYTGIVTINMNEKIPFFIWDRPGRRQTLMDTEGRIIDGVDVNEFRGLLVVSGVGAPKHAPFLMEMLMAEPSVAAHVKYARWVGDRRWTLLTSRDVQILLPDNDIGFALSRLAKLEAEKNIFAKDLLAIDLRLSDRIIIESQDGKARSFNTKASMDNI